MNPTVRLTLTVVRRVLIIAMMVLILVRPTWGEVKVKTERADLDVLFVIDRTRSMIAEDGPGGTTRMEQAKQDMRLLVRELTGARIAAITFGGEVVRTQLPFITDANAFDNLLDNIEVEGPFDGVGSKVDAPLTEMAEVLEADAEQYPDRRRLVIMVTDGENTADGEQRSFEPLTEWTSGGAVLGYGTPEGGRMLVDETDPSQGYMTDEDGDDAISRVDATNLDRIAGELDLEVLRRDNGQEQPLKDLVASFEAMEVTSDASRAHGREITWVFGIGLVPLLIWELWPARRTIREVRRFQG